MLHLPTLLLFGNLFPLNIRHTQFHSPPALSICQIFQDEKCKAQTAHAFLLNPTPFFLVKYQRLLSEFSREVVGGVSLINLVTQQLKSGVIAKMEKLSAGLSHLFMTIFLHNFATFMVIPAITDVTMSALCPGRDECSIAIYLTGFQQAVRTIFYT